MCSQRHFLPLTAHYRFHNTDTKTLPLRHFKPTTLTSCDYFCQVFAVCWSWSGLVQIHASQTNNLKASWKGETVWERRWWNWFSRRRTIERAWYRHVDHPKVTVSNNPGGAVGWTGGAQSWPPEGHVVLKLDDFPPPLPLYKLKRGSDKFICQRGIKQAPSK